MRLDVLVDLTPLETPSRYDGTGRYLRELGQALRNLGPAERRGLAIEGLVSLAGPRAIGPLDWQGSPEPLWGADAELAWLNARRSRLALTLRRLRPRLFHATYQLGTPRGSGVPRVTTCMDLIRLVMHEQYLPGRFIYRRVLLAAEALRYHSARRVQAISEHTAHDLVQLLGVPSRKIDVVLQGLDHQRFRPYEGEARLEADAVWRRYGLTEGAYFVYAGNADPRKNVDVLIAAFAQARLDGFELALLGRQRPQDQRRIDAALAASGNPRGVRQLGFVPEADLPAIYSGACAFVFCSVYEGFGLPVTEAMACGCPAIHTGLTAMKETVGDAGLVVPARDARATAHAMSRIAREPRLHAELRRAGIARVQRFHWSRTAADTVESYARALG